MTTPDPRLAPRVAAALLLAGCATSTDRELVETRTRALFPDDPPLAERPSAPAPPLDGLDAYVAYGLEHGAAVRAAYEEWRALAEDVEPASTLPDPRLTYGEFLEEVQTRTGPQERRFGLAQSFPWPGELDARARAADRRAEAAWHRVERARLTTVEAIELAHHEYALLGREVSIARELLDLLRGLEPVVQARIRAGAGQEDLLRLQIEIGRLEDDLASLERRRPALSARLADAMTLVEGTEPLPVPLLEPPETRIVDVAAARERALAANPELRARARELEASRAAVEVEGFRRKPDLALGLDYVQTGAALDPGAPGSGDDPILLRLSTSLPIWTSSYDAAERAARHRVRAARGRLDAAESSLRAEVEEQAFQVDDAARRIALYRDSLVPRAREALDLTLTSYRAGTASVLDLIDLERALLEFERSYWRACRDYERGRTRLRALTNGDER